MFFKYFPCYISNFLTSLFRTNFSQRTRKSGENISENTCLIALGVSKGRCTSVAKILAEEKHRGVIPKFSVNFPLEAFANSMQSGEKLRRASELPGVLEVGEEIFLSSGSTSRRHSGKHSRLLVRTPGEQQNKSKREEKRQALTNEVGPALNQLNI